MKVTMTTPTMLGIAVASRDSSIFSISCPSLPPPSYGSAFWPLCGQKRPGAPEGGGGGKPQRRFRECHDHDLKLSGISTEAFPLRPCGPPPPYDEGGETRARPLR